MNKYFTSHKSLTITIHIKKKTENPNPVYTSRNNEQTLKLYQISRHVESTTADAHKDVATCRRLGNETHAWRRLPPPRVLQIYSI